MKHSIYSLRFRLILLVLLAVLPAFGLTLYTGWSDHQQHALEVQDNALRLARLTAASYNEMIASGHQLLIALTEVDEVADSQSNPTACATFLAKLVALYPRYTNFTVSAPNGDLICSGVPVEGQVNFADREWFQRLLEKRDFVVGEYVIGRIVGRPLLPLVYPVFSLTGEIKTVMTAAIDLAWINQLPVNAELPEGSVSTLLDHKGTIMARAPDPEGWIGQTLSEAPFVETILTQQEGTIEIEGIDGVQRLYAYLSLGTPPDVDGYILVGIPSQVAYATTNKSLYRHLIGLGVVAVLALLAAWVGGDVLLLRRVRALLKATQRLASGDLSARTGVTQARGELSQLAMAFDEMAGTLEDRTRSLARSEAEFRMLAENALVGIYRTTLGGDILYVNQYLAEMMGYETPEDMLQESVITRYKDPADRAALLEIIQKQGHVMAYDVDVLTKQGDLRHVMLSGWLEGETLSGMIIDITERKRAEEEVQRLKAFNEGIVQNMVEGIVVQDLQGCF
ncbi:MAG: PAS domain S-box protein, partial [Chloroflexota bacterium]